MKTPRITILATALAALVSSSAHAALTFTFQRVSDTEATMTATGNVGLGLPTGVNLGTFKDLELRGVMDGVGFGPIFGDVEQFAGDFQFAGTALQGWSVIGGDMLPFPEFFFGDLSTPSGSSSQRVAGGLIQWRPVGTTGEVWANYLSYDSSFSSANGPRKIGTWEIVAAPVPDSGSTVALLGSSLGFVLAAGGFPSFLRRRGAAQRLRSVQDSKPSQQAESKFPE